MEKDRNNPFFHMSGPKMGTTMKNPKYTKVAVTSLK